MEKTKDAVKQHLKEQWKHACNGYLVELLRMWELDAYYGYWIAEEIGGVGSCMYIQPRYNVWKQEMDGKAEFAKAEQNRKIKIEEAKANLEAEKLHAQAEIERAKGAAEAIRIENGSITPTYIQYLWVRQQNANANNPIIYIPTEAGLPILEAGKNGD